MHRAHAASGPWPASRRESVQAESGRSAGKTVAHLAAGRKERQCREHCHEHQQWRLADETALRGCSRGAIELQAQIALAVLVAGRAVEAVRHVSGRRKEQRDEREQGNQAMTTQKWHSVTWASGGLPKLEVSLAAGRHPGNSPIIRGL